MRARAGKRAELLEILRELVDAAADEPGTLVYAMHEAADDPDTVVSYELFADETALEAHKASPAVTDAMPRLESLLAEGSFRRLTPALETGLPQQSERREAGIPPSSERGPAARRH